MSGHSKWSKIKRAKGIADAKKGNIFTKLVKEIMAAVKAGDPNPDANIRLRLAIQKARDNNMPMDNIKRAIEKGSGKEAGPPPAEIVLEGYGPGGIAILVRALSDNKNRTVQEVRNVFNRNGGSLSESGGVAWLFESRGVIDIDTPSGKEDELALLAIDCGADDVKTSEGLIEAYTNPQQLEAIRHCLEVKGLKVTSAEPKLVPKTTTLAGEKVATQNIRLMDMLEDLEDVQSISSNLDFTEEVIEALKAQA